LADRLRIVSAAQHALFKRAAEDERYAAERGISQDMARAAIKAHEDAGSPSLPDRAERAGNTRKQSGAPDRRRSTVFLTSRHD